jgi:hypothetical protein
VSAAAKPPHPIAPRKTGASLRDAITKQFYRERLKAKHGCSQHLLKPHTALTADAAPISMRPRDFK